jgi:adenylate kinase
MSVVAAEKDLSLRSKSMHIVLIGAQGSGKGTQAQLLTQALSIEHVASGDLFRKAFDERTNLGIQARAYIDRGELVPDELTVAMVLQHVEALRQQQGALLDGFPRTVAQAQVLDKKFQRTGRQIDVAAYLAVPRAQLLARLSGRYLCRAEQHIYHQVTRPPKVAGICDLDGSELYQRSDDVGEAVQKRLDIFFHETILLLDYYREQGKLVEVNGNQSIEQVQTGLRKALRNQSKKAARATVADLRLAYEAIAFTS